MRLRTFSAVSLCLLMLAACGGGNKPAATTGGESAAPESAAPASGAASGAPGASASAGASARPAGSATPRVTATPAPPPPKSGAVTKAAPGTANIPKPGKYYYHSTSSGSFDSGQPTQTPTTYKDRENDSQIEYLPATDAANGCKQVQSKQGSQQNPQTTTYLWCSDKVLLVSISFSTGQGQATECKYNTPSGGIEIWHFPIKAEKFPTQTWKNDTCEGSWDIEFLSPEKVTAKGETYDVWKVRSKSTIKTTFTGTGQGGIPAGPQAVEINIDNNPQYMGVDVGVEVKSHSNSKTAFGTGKGDSTSDRELVSHP